MKLNVKISEKTIATMIANEVKSNKEFAALLVNVLKDSYKLDYVLSVIEDGVPTQKYKEGQKVQLEYKVWTNYIDQNGTIKEGLTTIQEGTVLYYSEYSENPYTIQYNTIDKEGKDTTETTSCSQSDIIKALK